MPIFYGITNIILNGGKTLDSFAFVGEGIEKVVLPNTLSAIYGNELLSISSALVLSAGIAIQNFPEGAVISMPLLSDGVSKPKSFLYGTLSGIVEPIAAALTLLLTRLTAIELSHNARSVAYLCISVLTP